MQLFAEVKRHKPSVIYIPGIDTWYHTLPDAVITTFIGLLKAIPPTDPVLVLGITDTPPDILDPGLLRDLFGYSKSNRFTIERPTRVSRVLRNFHGGHSQMIAKPYRVLLEYRIICKKNAKGLPRSSEPQEAEAGGVGNRTSATPKTTYQGGNQSTEEA